MKSVSPNYQEVLRIEKWLAQNNIPILNLHSEPTTIENGWSKVEKIKLNPSTFGAFAGMIEEATVQVTYGVAEWKNEEITDRVLRLVVDYQYQHPSGSNGYRLDLSSVNGEDWKI